MYAHLFNAYTALSNHYDWQGVIGMDKKGLVVCLKPVPFSGGGSRIWTAADYSRTNCWLTNFLGAAPAAGVVREAVMMVAEDSHQV